MFSDGKAKFLSGVRQLKFQPSVEGQPRCEMTGIIIREQQLAHEHLNSLGFFILYNLSIIYDGMAVKFSYV